MNTVIYVGNFSFPFGNAAGKRVYANGKAFRNLGYQVVFVGMDKDVNRNLKLERTKKTYDGFTYYNFIYPKSNKDWVNYRKTYNNLIELIEESKYCDDIEMIIYYGSPSLSLFNTKLIKYAKKKDISIITDCVDWLTAKTSNPIFNLIKWADNTYQKAYANKKADGVIAISKYLENYYKKAGLKTVVVPPLSPIKYELSRNDDDIKIISYAGIPFRKGKAINDPSSLKDRIDKTIIILNQVKNNGTKFKFNIYGFTKEEYLQALPNQKKYIYELGDSIEFHGLKNNDEVTEKIAKSDFTILIRDVNRDTTAGFPTKVSESISCGTPVITTRTSDLSDYIIDGENGFFIDVNNHDEAVRKIISILSQNKENINDMKKKCIGLGVFDYEKYEGKVRKFIDSL